MHFLCLPSLSKALSHIKSAFLFDILKKSQGQKTLKTQEQLNNSRQKLKVQARKETFRET